MILLISVISIAIFLIFAIKKEADEPLMKVLQNLYAKDEETLVQRNKGYLTMFFFRENTDNEYNYLNSMRVIETSDGVYLFPTINHFMVRRMYIPWKDLNKVGEKRLFLMKRRVFSIINTDIVVAF